MPDESGFRGTGPFWIAPIAEVLIVGLGVYLHLLVEALLLVNVTIGAFSLVILSLLTFSRKARKERGPDQYRPKQRNFQRREDGPKQRNFHPSPSPAKSRKGAWRGLVWLAWLPTLGIGYLVYKGSLPNGDFMLWLAIMGAAFTIYSMYRLISGFKASTH